MYTTPTLAIIGSDIGLSPFRRQAIIWTNAVLLSTWSLGTNLSQIVLKIQTFSFKKMHGKLLAILSGPLCEAIQQHVYYFHVTKVACWQLASQSLVRPVNELWGQVSAKKYVEDLIITDVSDEKCGYVNTLRPGNLIYMYLHQCTGLVIIGSGNYLFSARPFITCTNIISM